MAKKRRPKRPGRPSGEALARSGNSGSNGQAIAPKEHQESNLVRTLGGHVSRTLELGVCYALAWLLDHGGLKLLKWFVSGLIAKYPWAGVALDYVEIALSLLAAVLFFVHAGIEGYRNLTRSERKNN